MQDEGARHAGEPEGGGRKRSEPVGQGTAEHVPDRGRAAEHQQGKADLRGIEAEPTQRDREIGEHGEAAERP